MNKQETFESFYKPSGSLLQHDGYYIQDSTQAAWYGFQRAWDAQQAIIDRLMLEYCPEEMTTEQMIEWANHQRAVEDSITQKILTMAEKLEW